MFVPKHKRKDNLITQGGLVVKNSLVPYSGYYFEVSNGKKYTGRNPYDGVPQELVTPPMEIENEVTGQTYRTSKDLYDSLTKEADSYKLKITRAVEIYYPTNIPNTPTFKRYFARDKQNGKILEINVNVYKALKTQQPTYYFPRYDILELEWALQGSIEDTVVGKFTAPGIKSTNLRTVDKAEAKLPGIKRYLSNPLQFVK